MYQVFTDGSSSRKNKTIGTSYIIFKNEKIDTPINIFSKGFKDEQARNGIAELLGIYYFLYHFLLNKFHLDNEEIVIYSDSQYVVNEFNVWFRNQMIKNFYDTKNKEIIVYILWMLYILREKKGYKIRFEWVKGHQQDDVFEALGNNRADILAVNCHNYSNFETLIYVDVIIALLKGKIKREGILENLKKVYLNI